MKNWTETGRRELARCDENIKDLHKRAVAAGPLLTIAAALQHVTDLLPDYQLRWLAAVARDCLPQPVFALAPIGSLIELYISRLNAVPRGDIPGGLIYALQKASVLRDDDCPEFLDPVSEQFYVWVPEQKNRLARGVSVKLHDYQFFSEAVHDGLILSQPRSDWPALSCAVYPAEVAYKTAFSLPHRGSPTPPVMPSIGELLSSVTAYRGPLAIPSQSDLDAMLSSNGRRSPTRMRAQLDKETRKVLQRVVVLGMGPGWGLTNEQIGILLLEHGLTSSVDAGFRMASRVRERELPMMVTRWEQVGRV